MFHHQFFFEPELWTSNLQVTFNKVDKVEGSQWFYALETNEMANSHPKHDPWWLMATPCSDTATDAAQTNQRNPHPNLHVEAGWTRLLEAEAGDGTERVTCKAPIVDTIHKAHCQRSTIVHGSRWILSNGDEQVKVTCPGLVRLHISRKANMKLRNHVCQWTWKNRV